MMVSTYYYETPMFFFIPLSSVLSILKMMLPLSFSFVHALLCFSRVTGSNESYIQNTSTSPVSSALSALG